MNPKAINYCVQRFQGKNYYEIEQGSYDSDAVYMHGPLSWPEAVAECRALNQDLARETRKTRSARKDLLVYLAKHQISIQQANKILNWREGMPVFHYPKNALKSEVSQ